MKLLQRPWYAVGQCVAEPMTRDKFVVAKTNRPRMKKMIVLLSPSFVRKWCYGIVLTCFVGIITGFLPVDHAQSQEKVYTLLMLNFARGIQWPDASQNDNFVIGVFEYPPLASELNNAASTTKIGNRKIVVKEFTRADDIQDCHILFVPAYKARSLDAVLNKVGSDPTLIVTNKSDLAKKGSGVNFILVEGKLRYEINCKSIEKRGMKISANVKGMGIVVE